jgi:Holliday junction DNA helicase RuvA
MISSLCGTVKQIQDQLITLDIGVLCLEVHVPVATPWAVEETVRFFSYMHWHQEQGPTLFGFATEFERQVFLLIISCSGIGPKIGLALLAELGAVNFVTAMQQEDERALSRVSGIGARKAEQIIINLRHKIAKLIDKGVSPASVERTDWHLVSQTLESLKYSRFEITRALAHVRGVYASQMIPFDQLVKTALTFLSKPS